MHELLQLSLSSSLRLLVHEPSASCRIVKADHGTDVGDVLPSFLHVPLHLQSVDYDFLRAVIGELVGSIFFLFSTMTVSTACRVQMLHRALALQRMQRPQHHWYECEHVRCWRLPAAIAGAVLHSQQ